MFATTFYSYKGGVGRTMALANVASELAKRGKSVLVADFDLEAPGLSSFPFNGCAAQQQQPGLVEFIHSWIDQGRAPDVREYVYEQRNDDPSYGLIYVMPAGAASSDYGSKLRLINFDELYASRDGYILFEDLKAQWAKVLKVDYVLIDSRTGHTDVGGICTRQLPDLVVFVFWPNVQNLDGLRSIIQRIESDGSSTGKEIARIFVPSNLPTLDDEDELLKNSLSQFRATLSYDADDEVKISNYPSLDLLAQEIFTVGRPKSRLAKEYRALTDAISSNNIEDSRGVKVFLSKVTGSKNWRSTSRPSIIDGTASAAHQKRYEAIKQHNWEDSDVNRMLAYIGASTGEFADSIPFLEKVIKKGDAILADYLRIAEWIIASGIPTNADAVLDRLLDDEEASTRHLVAAVRLIARLELAEPTDLTTRAAVRRLTPKQAERVVNALNASLAEVQITSRIVLEVIRRAHQAGETLSHSTASTLSLPLIGAAFFKESVHLLQPYASDPSLASTAVYFNLAMARWGVEQHPTNDDFQKVIEADTQPDSSDPNYLQCFALCNAVVGNQSLAYELLGRSRAQIANQSPSFSCWSYLQVGEGAFLAELTSLALFIECGQPIPRVFDRGEKTALSGTSTK